MCLFKCVYFLPVCLIMSLSVLYTILQLWEAVSGKCVATLVGHKEEVLDVCFDLSGQLIATASADGERNNSYLISQKMNIVPRTNKHFACFLSLSLRYSTSFQCKNTSVSRDPRGPCWRDLQGRSLDLFCLCKLNRDFLLFNL